jgi:hypothetical protein
MLVEYAHVCCKFFNIKNPHFNRYLHTQAQIEHFWGFFHQTRSNLTVIKTVNNKIQEYTKVDTFKFDYTIKLHH